MCLCIWHTFPRKSHNCTCARPKKPRCNGIFITQSENGTKMICGIWTRLQDERSKLCVKTPTKFVCFTLKVPTDIQLRTVLAKFADKFGSPILNFVRSWAVSLPSSEGRRWDSAHDFRSNLNLNTGSLASFSQPWLGKNNAIYSVQRSLIAKEGERRSLMTWRWRFFFVTQKCQPSIAKLEWSPTL